MKLWEIPYIDDFEALIESNDILNDRYVRMKRTLSTQFSYFYHSLNGFDSIVELLTRRNLSYQIFLEDLEAGTMLFEKSFKSKLGITKVFKTPSIFESQNLNLLELISKRGNQFSLNEIFKHFNLNIELDQLVLTDFDHTNNNYQVRGDLTEAKYSSEIIESMTMNDIDEFPVENFPIYTGIVSPQVKVDLNGYSNFVALIEAMILDDHEFINTKMDNELTVSEYYAMHLAINNMINGAFNNYDEEDNGFSGIQANSAIPLYDKELFRALFVNKNNLILTDKEYSRIVNHLAWSNLDALEDFETINSIEMNSVTGDKISSEFVNKTLFTNLIQYALTEGYELRSEKVSVDKIAGHFTHIQRVYEYCLMKQHPLMYLKKYASNINVLKATLSMIYEYRTKTDILRTQSARIIDDIRRYFNNTKPLGQAFSFEYVLDPRITLNSLKDELPELVPYYVQFIDEKITYQIRTNFRFNHKVYRIEKYIVETPIIFNHSMTDSKIIYSPLVFDYKVNNTIKLGTEFTFINKAGPVLKLNSNFEFFNNTKKTDLFNTYLKFTHLNYWKQRMYIAEESMNSWEFFSFKVNADDNDISSSEINNWKRLDPSSEPDNLGYHYPISNSFTGFTTLSKYKNFRMTCEIYSEDLNPNQIGIILGRFTDPENKEYTITAIRSNIANQTWKVYYNYNLRSQAGIQDKSTLVPINGRAGISDGWDEFPNRINIVYEKVGSIMKIATSTADDSNIKLDSTLTVNLQEDYPGIDATSLGKIENESPIGFGCKGQGNVRIKNVLIETINAFELP